MPLSTFTHHFEELHERHRRIEANQASGEQHVGSRFVEGLFRYVGTIDAVAERLLGLTGVVPGPAPITDAVARNTTEAVRRTAVPRPRTPGL